MRYSGKEAILLLLINALHVNCRTVLKTRNVNETDSPLSLKAYEVEACDCGSGGSCVLDTSGEKICNCFPGYVPHNGRCYECNCGENSISCRYKQYGIKECNCSSGYTQFNLNCEECNCGPYGSCSFVKGKKRCNCKPSAVENNGVCVMESTTLEDSTVITTTSLPSTTRYCDCGENSKSCKYIRLAFTYRKSCDCFPGYAEYQGTCEECNCGLNVRSCYPRGNGTKLCLCDFGYIETNGYCTAICNEDKCINGECEELEDSFKCRCNEGFTGLRCEEKIQTKSNKQDLWMILLLAGVFAVVFLLSCMFCVWTRILIRSSKK